MLQLTSCPRCSYKLRGLPEKHRCPECGLGYDENSGIWRRHPRWRELFWPALIYVYVFSTSLGAFQTTPRYITILILLCSAGWAIYIVYNFLILIRDGRFAAVLPDELMLRLDKKDSISIPWGNITRVAVKPSPLGAVIFLKKEREVKDILGVFSKRAEAEMFVKCASVQISKLREGDVSSGETHET